MIRVPGFVDAHAHLQLEGAPIGMPIAELRAAGIVAAVDCGTSGAEGFAEAVRTWSAQIAVRAYVNAAPRGLRGTREDWGPPGDDVLEALAGLRPFGVKLRLGEGSDDAADLRRVVDAARQLKLPVMIHPTNSSVPRDAVLAQLREGDVLTHCYCPGAWSILESDGRVARAARDARSRGVRFDVGRSSGRHFDATIARNAVAQDFGPDFISTDRVAMLRPGTKPFTLFDVISEMVELGMSPDAALEAASSAPAHFFGFDLDAASDGTWIEVDDRVKSFTIETG